MKIKSFLLAFLIILFYNSLAYAITTEEAEVKALYKKLYDIVFEKIDISNIPDVDEKKITDALNYVIDIYKIKPDSFEAYYSSFLVQHLLKNTVKEKYNQMKETHIPNLNDPDFQTAEKLIFLRIMTSSWVGNSQVENKEYYDKAIENLKNIKNNCKNKSYAALASALLSWDENMSLDCKKNIIELIPQSQAIPYIKGEIVYLENEDNPEKSIKELQKLINDYGNLYTPNGDKMLMEYYTLIADSYINLKDYENAKKYYDFIEKESPNNWNLRYLKTALKHLKLKGKYKSN